MLKNKIYLLRKSYKTAPFVIGVLVLLYSFSPFCISERFVFPNQIQIIVILAYIAVIISGYLLFKVVIHLHNVEMRISNIDIAVFIYGIYSTCNYLFHYHTIQPEVVFENFSLIVLYILLRDIKKQSATNLLFIFPIIGISQIIYGIKNQANDFAPGYGLSDIIGIFYNSGIFGGFMAIVFIVTLGVTIYLSHITGFKIKSRIQPYLRFLLLLILLILFVQLIASKSRAAWCACLVGILYYLDSYFGLFTRFLELSFIKKSTISILSISLLCISLYGFYNLRKESADGRILIWKVSCNMIKDKPLFGHGANGFRANYMEYQAKYFEMHQKSSYSYLADDNHYAFNEFIRIWVEQGTVGLILYIQILYQLFFNRKNRIKNKNITTFKAALITLLVFSFFSYPMDILQFNLLTVFFISIISAQSIIKKQIRLTNIIHESASRVTKLKLLTIGIISVWFAVSVNIVSASINYNTACKQWNAALRDFNRNNTPESISKLNESFPRLKNNGVFLNTYGKALNLSGQYTESIPILMRANVQLSSASNYIELGKSYKATGQFENAKNAWRKASSMIPAMFTPHYLTAKMYCQIGKTADAHQIANNLLRKEVKVRSPALNEMLAEMDSIVKTQK